MELIYFLQYYMEHGEEIQMPEKVKSKFIFKLELLETFKIVDMNIVNCQLTMNCFDTYHDRSTINPYHSHS